MQPHSGQGMIQRIYDRGQPLVQIGLVITMALTSVMLPQVRQSFIHFNHKKWYGQKQRLIQMVLFFAASASIGLCAIMPI